MASGRRLVSYCDLKWFSIDRNRCQCVDAHPTSKPTHRRHPYHPGIIGFIVLLSFARVAVVNCLDSGSYFKMPTATTATTRSQFVYEYEDSPNRNNSGVDDGTGDPIVPLAMPPAPHHRRVATASSPVGSDGANSTTNYGRLKFNLGRRGGQVLADEMDYFHQIMANEANEASEEADNEADDEAEEGDDEETDAEDDAEKAEDDGEEETEDADETSSSIKPDYLNLMSKLTFPIDAIAEVKQIETTTKQSSKSAMLSFEPSVPSDNRAISEMSFDEATKRLMQAKQRLEDPEQHKPVAPRPVKVESLHCAIERVNVPCRLDDLFDGVDQCSKRNWTAGMTFNVNPLLIEEPPTIYKIFVAPYHRKDPFAGDAHSVQDKAWLAITADDAQVQNPRKAISVTLIASCCLRQVRVVAETVSHDEDDCQFDFCNEGRCPASSVCTPDGQCICPAGLVGPNCDPEPSVNIVTEKEKSSPRAAGNAAAMARQGSAVHQSLHDKLFGMGMNQESPIGEVATQTVGDDYDQPQQATASRAPPLVQAGSDQQSTPQQSCAAGFLCCEVPPTEEGANGEPRVYFDPFGFFQCCTDGTVAPRGYCDSKNKRFGGGDGESSSINDEENLKAALATLQAFRYGSNRSDPIKWPTATPTERSRSSVKVIPHLPKQIAGEIRGESMRPPAVEPKSRSTYRQRNGSQRVRQGRLETRSRQGPAAVTRGSSKTESFASPISLRRVNKAGATTTTTRRSTRMATTTTTPAVTVTSPLDVLGKNVAMGSGEQLINCNHNYFSIPTSDRPFFSCCGNTLYFWLTERCQEGNTVVPRIEGARNEKPPVTPLVPSVSGKGLAKNIHPLSPSSSSSAQKSHKTLVEKLLNKIIMASAGFSTTETTTQQPQPPEAVTPIWTATAAETDTEAIESMNNAKGVAFKSEDETTTATSTSAASRWQVVSMVCNGAQYVVPMSQRDQLGCCGSHLYFPLTQKCKT